MIIMALIILIYLGYLVGLHTSAGSDRISGAGTGVLIVLLLISLLEYYALLANIKIDRKLIYEIFLLLVGIAIYLKSKTNSDKPKKIPRSKSSVLSLLLIFTTTFLIAATWMYDSYWPVNDWDAVTLYDFRGKLISQKGGLADMLTMEPAYYLAYPFYTSLLHATIYILDYTHPSVLYALLMSAFALIYYSSVKKRTNKDVAAATLFLFSSTFVVFHHTQIAYTNLPYLIYFVSGIFFTLDTLEHKSWPQTLIAAILIGGSTWIRSDDPFWIIPLILFGFVALRQNRWRELLVYTLIIFSIKLPWSYYKSSLLSGLSASEVIVPSAIISQLTDLSLLSTRIKDVVIFVTKMIFQGFAFPLLLYTVSYVVSLGQSTKWQRYLRFVIFSTFFLVYLGTFGLSLIYSKWSIVGGSVQRMLMFIIPLILYDIGLTIYNEFSNLSQKS